MSEKSMVPFDEVRALAKAAAESRYYPGVQSAEQALILMSLAQAEGMRPIQALQRYHVIEGRPSKQSQAMLADFIASGGKIKWLRHDAQECKAEFSHPQGGTITTGFTIADAKTAGLSDRPNWKRYPENMLHARCVSKGVRFCYPAATGGFHTPEETLDQSYDNGEQSAAGLWDKIQQPPAVQEAEFTEAPKVVDAAEIVQPEEPKPLRLAMPGDVCDRVPDDVCALSRKLTAKPFAEQADAELSATIATLQGLANKAKDPQNRAALSVVASFATAALQSRGAA